MPKAKIKNGIVDRYGKLWTRVPANIRKLKTEEMKRVSGVYALYNGNMPVYIGKGRFSKQIASHNRNRKKSPFWEHFSWYEIKIKSLEKEIESLLLMVLPHYLRSLNKMGGKFISAKKIEPASEAQVKILWPKGGAGKKYHRRK